MTPHLPTLASVCGPCQRPPANSLNQSCYRPTRKQGSTRDRATDETPLPKLRRLPALRAARPAWAAPACTMTARPRGFSFVHRLGEPPAAAGASLPGHPCRRKGPRPPVCHQRHGPAISSQSQRPVARAWRAARLPQHALGSRGKPAPIATRFASFAATTPARGLPSGFSSGANRACQLVQDLKAQESRSICWSILPATRSTTSRQAGRPNVGQIVNITRSRLLPRGGDLFYRAPDSRRRQRTSASTRGHMLLPTRRRRWRRWRRTSSQCEGNGHGPPVRPSAIMVRGAWILMAIRIAFGSDLFCPAIASKSAHRSYPSVATVEVIVRVPGKPAPRCFGTGIPGSLRRAREHSQPGGVRAFLAVRRKTRGSADRAVLRPW